MAALSKCSACRPRASSVNGLPGPPGFPSAPNYPITAGLGDSANAFFPDLKLDNVQSWTFGLQREIGPNTVIEARYYFVRPAAAAALIFLTNKFRNWTREPG